MPKKRVRKFNTKTTNINVENTKSNNGFFNKIKLMESYTSLIMGAIVVVIIGILIITFAKINRNMQASSTNSVANIEDIFPESDTSSTYTVRAGDNLWDISETVYDNGYKWVEIAKLNNLKNPGQIEIGDKLNLPKINKEEKIVEQNKSKTTEEIINTKSITGSEYVVVKGDCLWNIAVRAYGDGFKWVEIAKANKLVNPNLIHPGNHFVIPR
jgi:nucleoid-associated protein YgaU